MKPNTKKLERMIRTPIEHITFDTATQTEMKRGGEESLLIAQLAGISPRVLWGGAKKFGFRRWWEELSRVGVLSLENIRVAHIEVPPTIRDLQKNKYLVVRPTLPEEKRIVELRRQSRITRSVMVFLTQLPISTLGRVMDYCESYYDICRKTKTEPVRLDLSHLIHLLTTREIIAIAIALAKAKVMVIERKGLGYTCINTKYLLEIQEYLSTNPPEPNRDKIIGIVCSNSPRLSQGTSPIHRMEHTREGIVTEKGGLSRIGDINIPLPYTMSMGSVEDDIGKAMKLLTKAQKDIMEQTNLAIERTEKWYLTNQRMKQVCVFRTMVGRTISLNKTLRVMEFGTTISKYGWGGSKCQNNIIRIMGAKAIGLKDTWGWYVSMASRCCREGTNIGHVMVVPNELWDRMIWLWEKDVVIWPQFSEAHGIPIGTLPAWNGAENIQCYGSLAIDQIPRSPYFTYRRYNSSNRTKVGEPQAQMAVTLQTATASLDAYIKGDMEVYIPRQAFKTGLSKIRRKLKKYKIDGDQELLVDILNKTIPEELGMLCSIGNDPGVAIWMKPVCGKHSHLWWWRTPQIPTTNTQGVEVPIRYGYPSIAKIKRKIEERGLGTSSGVQAYLLKSNSKGEVIGNQESRYAGRCGLSPYEIWELAYKGLYGVYSSGLLCNLRDSRDSERTGKVLRIYEHILSPTDRKARGLPPREVHKRITGRTPFITPSEKKNRIQVQNKRYRGIIPPLCNIEECTHAHCNPSPRYINYLPKVRLYPNHQTTGETTELPRRIPVAARIPAEETLRRLRGIQRALGNT